MELSLWANHPKDQPSLSHWRLDGKTNLQIEGRRTPSVTVKIKYSGPCYMNLTHAWSCVPPAGYTPQPEI